MLVGGLFAFKKARLFTGLESALSLLTIRPQGNANLSQSLMRTRVIFQAWLLLVQSQASRLTLALSLSQAATVGVMVATSGTAAFAGKAK